MPAYTFMPYRYAESESGEECLTLRCDRLRLDGQPHEAIIADSFVDLSDETTWTTMQLDLSVTVTGDSQAGLSRLEECLLAGETWSTGLNLVVTARDASGRSRVPVWLTAPEDAAPGRWQGTLTVDRREASGPIGLVAYAVRSTDAASGEEGKARRKGERIAESARFSVHLIDRPSMPGGLFDGEWRDFSKEGSGLQSFEDCTSYLDLSDPDRPRLLLNERIEGLKQALMSEARRGAPARVRDQLMDSILSPVIHTLAVAALTEGASLEDDSELEGWRKGVLQCLARQSPASTEGPLIRDWLERWKAGKANEVLTQIAPLIQLHLNSGGSASWLVKEAGGKLNETDQDA